MGSGEVRQMGQRWPLWFCIIHDRGVTISSCRAEVSDGKFAAVGGSSRLCSPMLKRLVRHQGYKAHIQGEATERGRPSWRRSDPRLGFSAQLTSSDACDWNIQAYKIHHCLNVGILLSVICNQESPVGCKHQRLGVTSSLLSCGNQGSTC